MSFSKNLKYVYEDIAVIAIYLPNVSEIPFETNGGYLLEQYRRFLSECSEIMGRENGCRDVIMHNHYIYGIFDGYCDESIRRVAMLAKQIDVRIQEVIYGRAGYPEQMIYGIGVATGLAVTLPIKKRSNKIRHHIWMGNVFDKAFLLAQQSIHGGRNNQ